MGTNQAGKGDKIRKGADLQKYWDNYECIFKKDKATSKPNVETNKQAGDCAIIPQEHK